MSTTLYRAIADSLDRLASCEQDRGQFFYKLVSQLMQRLLKPLILVLIVTATAVPPTVVTLRPGGSLAGTEFGHLLTLFLRLDSFKVLTDPSLSPNQVDVYWNGWIEGTGESRVRIIHNGSPDQPIPIKYGENDFSVFYGGHCVLEKQRQFKFARWHYHRYTVNVSKAPNGQFSSRVSAIGPDSM